MSGYHFQVRNAVSRAKGKSAVAKAAYNAREKMRDERTGELKDYSRTHDQVLFSGIFVDPKRNAPAWVQDRAALWNAATAAEKRKDAREAQEIIVALPYQLTQQQREFMLKDFVREQITRGTGRIADVNMHSPPPGGDARNYHAHILMTLREVGPDGFGKRLPEIDSKQIETWKEKFAQRAARELRKAGYEQEAERWALGHLKKEQQREAALQRGDHEHAAWCEQEATKHRGPGATALERKGVETDRGNVERETVTASIERMKLARELAQVQKQIAAIERGDGLEPWRAPWEKTSPALHFEDATREAARRQTAPEMPNGLRGTQAQIWAAYNSRTWRQEWEETREDGTTYARSRDVQLRSDDPRRFAEALEEKGIRLASVSKDDAERSAGEAAAAQQAGRYMPALREGEFVAVNRYGDVYRFNQRNTGDDPRSVQRHLAKGELKGVQSLDAVQQIVRTEIAAREAQRQKRRDEIEAGRMERASNPGKIPQTKERIAEVAGRAAVGVVKELGKMPILGAREIVRDIAKPAKPVRSLAKGLGKALDALGGLLESLAAPPQPLTREQVKEEQRRSDAAAKDNEIEWSKYLYDNDAERIAAYQQEQERQRQTEREQHDRLRGRERER